MILTRPRIHGDRLFFHSEDDLWTVALTGVGARRLTRGASRITSSTLSRDGRKIALVAREEGAQDVYLMDAEGGAITRRSWLGVSMEALEFAPDDSSVRIAARRGGPLDKEHQLWEVPCVQGVHQHAQLGPVSGFAELDGKRVLCRFSTDLARWKRYRGGRVGRLWVDIGDGWSELPDLGGNLASPFWRGGRIGFVSDHEGHANLYSCNPDGSDVQRLTEHGDFSVRHPSAHEDRIVYGTGGRIWCIDGEDAPRQLDIDTRSQRTRLQLRFPTASRFLGGVDLHPGGHSMAITTRGRPFIGGFWEGPMLQLGQRQGARYSHVHWLDDDRLVWATDANGEQEIQVHHVGTRETTTVVTKLPGRVIRIAVGGAERVAITTHDSRLLVLDLSTGSLQLVEHNDRYPQQDATWSPDGRWLAWSRQSSRGMAQIRLADTESSSDDGFNITDVTDGRYHDRRPDFDPLGRYLYFLSNREFSPIPDQYFFGYSFPKGGRPYLVTLSADTTSPFEHDPRDFSKPKPSKPPEKWTIDLPGIQDRLVRFPVVEANYHQVVGLPSGRVLFLREGVAPAVSWKPGQVQPGRKTLILWDYDTHEAQVVHTKVSSISLDANRKTLAMRTGNKLRVFPADADKGKRAELKKDEPFRARRKSHWVDLNRIRLAVEPQAEWKQMALETWRLMRDHFWDEKMAGVDWAAVRDRYLPLFDEAGTRSEVSELLWAMVGEVATSHAYEIGGSYATQVTRSIGRLAAELSWDGDAWVVDTVHRGDPGDPKRSSPLLAPGVGAIEGTRILRVNGEPVEEHRPVEAALVGHSGRPVELEFSRDGEVRTGWIKPLISDQGARYRSWVARNRAEVHKATKGRIGYVHAPNMGSDGFADFHRDFLHACEHDGLIVDVRFNGGGHVSQLLLARLQKRRLAYVSARHFGVSPNPSHSVLGPMVALTNENAGSDGDIFSYNWKALKLGPLIGTRTWGGVVGISPRTTLVDGTVVTQPEFAFWFEGGGGWGVEGHGVDPDIEVRHSPEDYLAGRDAQLDLAISEAKKLLKKQKTKLPKFGPPPKR